MRQFLVSILALVYLVTSTGAIMHTHFCMGELADWSLWEKNEGSSCSKCGMESGVPSEGCCSNESQWIKIEDEQKAAFTNFDFTPIQDVESNFITGLNYSYHFSEGACFIPQNHAPPNISFSKIYKFICVLLI